ncbi:MAG: PstS family phosphate ABC transporter substrate-binding protein [Bacteroidota bacterium]
MKSSFCCFGLMVWLLNSCETHENPLAYQTDAHGRGKASIFVEDSYRPLFETSIYTFESQYPKASIKATYLSEGQIIDSFFANKVKTICISRDFSEKEKDYLKSKNVEVKSDLLAYDAIALIVHPSNQDTVVSVEQLKHWISNDGAKWPGSRKPVKMVFDRVTSANFNYLVNLSEKKSLSKSVYALNSNEEVINYVKSNPNALGFIGVNWISDQEDLEVMNFLDSLKVLYVSEKTGQPGFQPYAGTIWTKEYPLHREMWFVNKGRRAGLNTGFVLFMLGEKGQLLVQKSELVPAKAPVRLIQFTTN